MEGLNFAALLKTDYERELCDKFIFKYDALLQDLHRSLVDANSAQLQLHVPCQRVCSFLFDMTNLFSKYYSKIHIMEVSCKFFLSNALQYFQKCHVKCLEKDPSCTHLHNTMFARVYLVKAIEAIYAKLLNNYLNIEQLDRI